MSNKLFFSFASAAVALATLSACSATPVTKADLKKAHYWQRVDTSDAIYQRGAQAQQMLHRDISRCVVEIKELERLGTLRKAIPADHSYYADIPEPKAARAQLEEWDTPEREGALYAEQGDYYDFESCMVFKGWERIDHVPYDVKERAYDTYIETILREDPDPVQHTSRKTTRSSSASTTRDGDFSNLND